MASTRPNENGTLEPRRHRTPACASRTRRCAPRMYARSRILAEPRPDDAGMVKLSRRASKAWQGSDAEEGEAKASYCAAPARQAEAQKSTNGRVWALTPGPAEPSPAEDSRGMGQRGILFGALPQPFTQGASCSLGHLRSAHDVHVSRARVVKLVIEKVWCFRFQSSRIPCRVTFVVSLASPLNGRV